MTSTTRQTMIAGAASLLAQRGMSGTSFSEVLAVTEAPRGSLYHHFPGGKDELMAEATRYVRDQLLTGLTLREPTTPSEVIALFTSLWRSVLTGANFEAGCAVAAVAVDAGPNHEELTDLVASVFQEWRHALATKLTAAGMSEEDSVALSLFALVAVEGALVVCRAQRSLDDFDRVAEMLQSLAADAPD